jgi:undecaprenyl phosphate N,N'-diacetylbacillosamine 1-phosphate transferase
MIYIKIVKPFFDFVFSLLLLIIVFPVMVVVAILVKLDSRGPILFSQERLGMNYRIFRVFKFRTMTHTNDRQQRQIFAGDPEVTRIGVYLRRLKLDELPQLFNILAGNMSFVGPRPSLPNLQERFNEDGHSRVKVKPGLTGLAAVKGSIFLSWPERWVYDRQYVENLSFIMDITILFKTVFVVLLGEKIFFKKSQQSEPTGTHK